MIYEFSGHRPVVDPSAFVHPQAAVTGNVAIGKNVYIGPGAAIRGDWGRIVIEDGCNVQENCTIHMFPGVTVWLKEGAHIGHGAIVHGAVIGRNCLIGMNSVVMDNVEIGDECIIGALTFIKAGEKIPGRSVVAGSPGRILKEVSEEMIRWKTEGTALYQALPGEMRKTWREAEHGRRQFSIEDYLEMERYSTQKHEYYQGSIFAMAGARPEHNRIVFNLTRSLVLKLQGKSCDIFNSDQRVHVKANSLFTYPDLSIVCGQPLFYEDKMSLTNPAVIVEVLSPSTRNYDRGDKFRLYQELPGLQEYVLIESQSMGAEYFRKEAGNGWVLRKFDQPTDFIRIETIGASLPLEEIYRNIPFPAKNQ